MTRQTADAAGHIDAAAHDDTIHHHDHDTAGTAGTATPPPTKAKVCVICGVNVAGQRRYKDGAGRYYCEECFTAQTSDADSDDAAGSAAAPSRATPAPAPKAKRLATCPDCKQEFEPASLIDFSGVKLCEKCIQHREQAARREAARIAAAEEEARRQEQRKKMWMLIGGIVVAALALYGILRLAVG